MSLKSKSSMFPIVLVDLDTRISGPHPLPGECPPNPGVSYIPPPPPATSTDDASQHAPGEETQAAPESQAKQANSQWCCNGAQPADKPWLKSWYFPTSAFDPWPDGASGLCCWHCSCPFDWAPFPLPRSYDKCSGRYRVMAAGFCGPSCAKAYALYAGDMVNLPRVFAMVDCIAHRFYGYGSPGGHQAIAPVAPRKEVLAKFCGPSGQTIEQFRSLCQHGRSLVVHPPGFITVKQVLEAEDSNVRAMASVGGTSRVHHFDDPDDIKPINELVRTKRAVFCGKGIKPLNMFMREAATKY